ncbi:MAG: cytochrome c3 family protein, partial [Verrucomicrobiota bacterium]
MVQATMLQNVAAISMLLFLASGCSRESDPGSSSAKVLPADSTNAQAPQSADFLNTLPQVGGPAGYTGSKACQSCHEDQFASWHRSYHRTMTQVAAPESVQADFHNVVLTNETTRFKLSRKGEEFWVRMEPIHIRAGENQPPPLEVRIGLITGSHHMQVFWIPEGHGNLQVGFPFTWLNPEKRWVPRNSTFIRPPDLEHRPEAWNMVCSRCHATGVEPRFDARTRSVETRIGELGISCEACHGPGERHVKAQLALQGSVPKEAAKLAPNEIVHPKKLPPVRASQVCGFCHSMKWFENSEQWRVKGFEFRPGDDLEKTTPLIHPSRVHENPALAEYLRRNPDILSDFFWPDGMIRVSGRELNGLEQSPCFKGNQFSCLSCHSLHESEPDDQLATRGKDNRACTQCHKQFGEPAELTAHTHHRADSPGSLCYNCHMPHTSYGILKAIRSHQISNPKVSQDLETGRPNACNLCHLNQSIGWTAEHLHQWFQQEKPALPEVLNQISHAARLGLTGDAG